MKISHWTITNGSGMHRVAESLVTAEQARGLDSALADPTIEATWDFHVDSDIHVVHTHLPNKLRKMVTKPLRIVWVGHGTPDHVFQSACEEFDHGNYGHGDPIGLTMEWIKTAHARVTFWDRHAWIYDRMLSTGSRKTDVIPMGVDTDFWGQGVTAGKFAGEPSFFTAENPHWIKTPYDLFTAWGTVSDEFPEAKLHSVYVPRDMHRAFFPWFNQMGSFWNAYVSAAVYPREWLRNAFQSTDYFVGLVRYGDFNHLCMQANAAGATTISYPGNPYSDFWIPEGDQRLIAEHLIRISKGDVSPRQKLPVPRIEDTATAMVKVYEDIAP